MNIEKIDINSLNIEKNKTNKQYILRGLELADCFEIAAGDRPAWNSACQYFNLMNEGKMVRIMKHEGRIICVRLR